MKIKLCTEQKQTLPDFILLVTSPWMHEPSDTYQIPYVIGLRTGIVQGSRHSAITHITKTRKNGRVQKPVPVLSGSMIHTVHSEVYITFTYINHCQWNTCSEPEILVLYTLYHAVSMLVKRRQKPRRERSVTYRITQKIITWSFVWSCTILCVLHKLSISSSFSIDRPNMWKNTASWNST